MAEIIKLEVVDLPRLYLVGKESSYNSEMFIKGDNRIPAFWDKCSAENIFSVLEKQSEHIYAPAYAGMLTGWDIAYGKFKYICGMIFKEGVTVPKGFVAYEFGAEKVGLCWVKGKKADVCTNAHDLAVKSMRNIGLNPDAMKWYIEMFSNPHFTTPDENGDIILDCYIPISQTFESLGKRIIHSFLATYPVFKPVSDCSSGVSSQKQMYDFLYDSIITIYNGLSIINAVNEPDDCYENWQLINSRPELILKMQKIRKNFFDFYDYLNKLGLLGEPAENKLIIKKEDLRITQKTKDKLSFFGLECEENKDAYFFRHVRYQELFPAWKLHCRVSKDNYMQSQNMMIFLHGRFGGKQYSASEMFGRLMDTALITELEEFFLEKGYPCKNDEMGVSYEKEYPKKQKAYMHIYYDWRKKTPLRLEFKIPHFSEVIKYYDRMDNELKDLVFNRTKICDGCGYCVQTDKSGKRPRLAISLELNGDTKLKCPLFPSFVWSDVSEATIGMVKKLFNFAESVL